MSQTSECGADNSTDDNRLAFRMNAQVVGKRFYSGKMNDNEMVHLVREPTNPYDRNAIKVLSITHQQVGHISAKCGTAGLLSPIADFKLPGGAGGSLEAGILGGANNTYSARAEVSIVCSPAHKEAILKRLSASAMPFQDMETRQCYRGFYDPLQVRSGAGAGSPSAAPAAMPAHYKRMTEEDVIKSMDSLWADRDAELSKLSFDASRHATLTQCMRSKLYPHQQQALCWMLNQELQPETALPPLYKQQGAQYTHELTRHSYNRKPAVSRGGALCDDMGLGKTLVAISLIIANPCPRRQSFVADLVKAEVDDLDEPSSSSISRSKYNVPTDTSLQQIARAMRPATPPPSPHTAATAAAAAAAGDALPPPPATTAKTGSVADLKAKLKQLGLKITGNKAELLQRLEAANVETVSVAGAAVSGGSSFVAACKSACANVLSSAASFVSSSVPQPQLHNVGGGGGGGGAPTLIVCPMSVMSVWQAQIQQHVAPGALKVLLFHGSNRARNEEELLQYDVVITSFDTVGAEHDAERGGAGAAAAAAASTALVVANPTEAKKRGRSGGGVLQRVQWHRIILDEAHVIRNLKTNKSKACLALKSTYSWALTGTPIVNTAADFHAILQLVRLEPFVSDPRLFDMHITRKIKNGDPQAVAHFTALVKTVALRRLKREVLEIALPEKEEIIVSVQLSPSEQEAYDAIKRAVQDYVAFVTELGGQDAVLSQTSTVLAFITRLRQCVLDVRLVPVEVLVRLLSVVKGMGPNKSSASSGGASGMARLSVEEQEAMLRKFQSLFATAGGSGELACYGDAGDGDAAYLECCICLDSMLQDDSAEAETAIAIVGSPPSTPASTPALTPVIFRACMHTFCSTCVNQLFQGQSQVPCPMCRTVIKKGDFASYPELKASLAAIGAAAATQQQPPASAAAAAAAAVGSAATSESRGHSSKTKEIVKALADIQRQGLGEKVVIFSNFVQYLKLLRTAIEEDLGVQTAQLTGEMTHSKRLKEIEHFSSDPSVNVILCSVHAAGVGITLHAANHIFLTDLWWAPAVDLQAIDRVHRMGQQRRVHVKRFLVKDSVDERIFGIQKEKNELATLTFARSAEAARGNRMRDINAILS